MRTYIKELSARHGAPFIITLFAIYFGLKGVAAGLAGSAALPLFMKRFKVSIERFQAYEIAIMTPWSLKPAIGLISDLLPVRGQSKVPYMIFASVLGTASFGGLAFIHQCSAGAAKIAALLLTVISFEIATVDLLAEGKYAEQMRKHPETGGALPSFVWASLFVGSIVAAAVAGPLSDAGHYRDIFVLAIPAASCVIGPLVRGWFPDPQNVKAGCAKLKAVATGGTVSNQRLATLAIMMAASSVALTVISLRTRNPTIKLAFAVTVSVTLCIAAHYLLPPKIARCNLYMFLATTSHISLVGALDYFYTASKECIHDAPHFSMTFFVTWSQIAASVASLLAVAIFQRYLQSWRLRPLFWVSTVVRCAAAVADLVIVNRLNKRVGIPDKIAYMLGNNVAESVAGQLDLMPAVVLTSKLCPPGMEATVYAILAGFQNFGGSVSAAVGSALTSQFNIKADLDTNECSFDGLSGLIILSHIIMPLLVVPLTFLLIPNAALKDPL